MLLYILMVYGVFLVGLSVCKSAEWFLPQLYVIEHWLGGDKWMHLTLSTILASLVFFATERKIGMTGVKRVTILFVILFVLLATDELLQYFVSTRRLDIKDFVAGMTGLVLGLLFYVVLNGLLKLRNVLVKK
ncbi:MAG: VanZ family protein [Oleibacter sp.]|nr:VanZ family protein [Thalassolituus sp.]